MLARARLQHDVLTRADLLDAGLTEAAIRQRVKTGRLHRVHRGVFAIGRPQLTKEGRWLAAVLACGKGAVLSHLTAAVLWGIWTRRGPSRPQVSVPGRGGRSGLPGVEIHRPQRLPNADTTTRNAIPVTTLARTLLDLAAVLNARQLRSMLRQAERLHGLDLPALRGSLDALPPSDHRRARITRVLDAYVPQMRDTESDYEAEFLALCAKHGIPLPEPQPEIGPYRPDFIWRDLGLAVEIDDRESHDGHIAFREDRVRQRYLQARSLDVIRFTTTEVTHEPASVAAETEAARMRRAAQRSIE